MKMAYEKNMLRMRKTKSTNSTLRNTLESIMRNSSSDFWMKVARELSKPSRHFKPVNISKIARLTKENDYVLVPGKVLSMGELPHKIRIAAFRLSGNALNKLKASNAEIMSINELARKNPEGKNIKIIV